MPVTKDYEEVVDGEIQIMPAPRSDHGYIVESLVADFMSQLDRKQYRILSGNFGLVIRTAPLTSRTPDLAIFERATIVVVDGYFRSAPQLAIVVQSPSETRRRTERKLRDYESLGIEEVWLISQQAGTVEILLLQDGALRQSRILTEGILKPKHFPGVQIDISGIWPD